MAGHIAVLPEMLVPASLSVLNISMSHLCKSITNSCHWIWNTSLLRPWINWKLWLLLLTFKHHMNSLHTITWITHIWDIPNLHYSWNWHHSNPDIHRNHRFSLTFSKIQTNYTVSFETEHIKIPTQSLLNFQHGSVVITNTIQMKNTDNTIYVNVQYRFPTKNKPRQGYLTSITWEVLERQLHLHTEQYTINSAAI